MGGRVEGRDPGTTASSGTHLPTGTVTFLFTDIEGSTGLLQDSVPGTRRSWTSMRRSSGRAVADGGGVEVSTHGDAIFVAFRSPLAAVRAAAAAQRGLASHDWSPGPPLRVRMGVHTGEGPLGGATLRRHRRAPCGPDRRRAPTAAR